MSYCASFLFSPEINPALWNHSLYFLHFFSRKGRSKMLSGDRKKFGPLDINCVITGLSQAGKYMYTPDQSSHFHSQLFWTPDVIIHDLVKFNKPEILNQVGALEIFKSGQVYYKVRSVDGISMTLWFYAQGGFKFSGVDGGSPLVVSSFKFYLWYFPIFYPLALFYPNQQREQKLTLNLEISFRRIFEVYFWGKGQGTIQNLNWIRCNHF